MGAFPLARSYADTEEGRRLVADHLFELIEYEYRRCWRLGIRTAARSEYRRLFPDLAGRIESDLRAAWDCPSVPRCGREVVGLAAAVGRSPSGAC